MTTIHVFSDDELEEFATRIAKRALDMRDLGDELTKGEAARLIRRREGAISLAIAAGHLPARREGKAWRINRKDLLAWNRATPRGKGASDA